MVDGFTYAISAYHHWCCEFESRSGRGVQHYVIKLVSDLRQVGGFLRYNWNIVESGVKHHQTNKQTIQNTGEVIIQYCHHRARHHIARFKTRTIKIIGLSFGKKINSSHIYWLIPFFYLWKFNLIARLFKLLKLVNKHTWIN